MSTRISNIVLENLRKAALAATGEIFEGIAEPALSAPPAAPAAKPKKKRKKAKRRAKAPQTPAAN